MKPEEFIALSDAIELDDKALAQRMETHRTSIARYRDGSRSIPGPVRVLMRAMSAVATGRAVAGSTPDWLAGILPAADQDA